MATVGNTNLTLTDWANRLDPDGKVAVISELLNTGDTLLDDIVWVEANGKQKHTGVVRTGLPDVYFRSINQGIPTSKSTTAKIEEVMSSIESRSCVDKKLMELNGNTAAFRMSEDRPFIEAMKQKMLKCMIYGNPKKDSNEFSGLHIRYNSSTAKNKDMIIDADSTASGSTYASAYMVVWGEQTCHGLFPSGSMAGLQQQDLGEGDATDGSGNQFRAYQSLFTWDAGLFVKDWESVGRIANISTAKLANGDIDIVKLLVQLTERVENQSSGRPVIYVPRSVRTCLRLQTLAKSNVNLTFDTVEGKRVLAFDGVPIKALKGLDFNENDF